LLSGLGYAAGLSCPETDRDGRCSLLALLRSLWAAPPARNPLHASSVPDRTRSKSSLVGGIKNPAVTAHPAE
jgi:hypothetical protein